MTFAVRRARHVRAEFITSSAGCQLAFRVWWCGWGCARSPDDEADADGSGGAADVPVAGAGRSDAVEADAGTAARLARRCPAPRGKAGSTTAWVSSISTMRTLRPVAAWVVVLPDLAGGGRRGRGVGHAASRLSVSGRAHDGMARGWGSSGMAGASSNGRGVRAREAPKPRHAGHRLRVVAEADRGHGDDEGNEREDVDHAASLYSRASAGCLAASVRDRNGRASMRHIQVIPSTTPTRNAVASAERMTIHRRMARQTANRVPAPGNRPNRP